VLPQIRGVCTTPPEPLRILFEDNHLLVVSKPAGLSSQPGDKGDNRGSNSLDLAKKYLCEKRKKDTAYVGLVHRLDRNVSGVLVFAKTSKAAARLSQSFRDRRTQKLYIAAVNCKDLFEVENRLLQGGGVRVDSKCILLHHNVDPASSPKPSRTQCFDVVPEGQGVYRGSLQSAKLLVSPLAVCSSSSIAYLKLELLTGRKHQIRAQLAYCGLPISGDCLYGHPGPLSSDRALGLHAYSIAFPHPTTKEWVRFSVELPRTLSWKLLLGKSSEESTRTLEKLEELMNDIPHHLNEI